jgi:hypothetical protein
MTCRTRLSESRPRGIEKGPHQRLHSVEGIM